MADPYQQWKKLLLIAVVVLVKCYDVSCYKFNQQFGVRKDQVIKSGVLEPCSQEETSSLLKSRRDFLQATSAGTFTLLGCSIASAETDKQTDLPSFKQDLWYDIDGAIGIKWGAKDTCNPTEDPDCGVNGVQIDLSGTQAPFTQDTFTITDKCSLSFLIGGSEFTIVVGLWGDVAPKSVTNFKKLCAGTFTSSDDDLVGVPFGYSQGGTINEVKRNEYIKVASVFLPAPFKTRRKAGDLLDKLKPMPNSEKNDRIKHSAAGLLSMKKNGSSVEFVITPRMNRRLDGEYIVIGQVLTGMDVVERINQTPVNNYKSAPLKKIIVSSCSVL